MIIVAEVTIMDCPRCGFKKYVKDGFANGKQRYQCKQCQYRYTITSIGYDKEVRYYALKMVVNPQYMVQF